ncbi:hypothetical protein MCOR08_008352 [Pyricularia oryzae]|nr:hypothetical protein MCOR08_008352 [Pyricularia oryzae]
MPRFSTVSATPPSAFKPAATTSYDSGAAPNPSFHHSRHTAQRYRGLSSLQTSKQKCRLPQMWNRLLADDKSSDVATRGTGSINCLHGEGEEMSLVQTSRSWTVILILTRICYCQPATVRGGRYAQHQSAEAASGIFKSTGISFESFARVDEANKTHPKIDKPSDCTG